MKILVNATNICDKLSGISVYVLSVLKELVKIDKENEYVIVVNKTAYGHLSEIIFPKNFKVKYVTKHISPEFRTRGHLLRLFYANYLGIRYINYLVFSTSQLEGVLFRRKQLIVVQDIIPLLNKELFKKQYYYFKYFLNIVLRRADYVIVPSLFTKNKVLENYTLDPAKITVTPLGIQNMYFKEIKNRDFKRENYILYVGRIAPTKNVERLIEAYNSIKNLISYKMVIVGNGKSEYIEYLKSKESYSKSITMLQNTDQNEVLEYYKKASLFVFPTLYEGFGLPPIEAMACGCPVVVSNTTSLPEVCGDAAEYVDPSDVKSIADGILKVLGNDKLRIELSKKGIERAKQFTWEKTARATLEIIKRFS